MRVLTCPSCFMLAAIRQALAKAVVAFYQKCEYGDPAECWSEGLRGACSQRPAWACGPVFVLTGSR